MVDGEDVRSRLISARETARLMGLKDSYKLPANYTEAYHLTGDGVAAPVVRHLAQYIFEPLLGVEAMAKGKRPINGKRPMSGRTVAEVGWLFGRNPDAVNFPLFETEDLRENLARLLDTPFEQTGLRVGNFRWGVYAFFDCDGEPIYVGQTNERLRTRVRRHLTNQRTDAVAMSVLDPFEVFEVELWPLPDFQNVNRSDVEARQGPNGSACHS